MNNKIQIRLEEFGLSDDSHNGFERHGITHISPSTINLFINHPALCMLKLMGITDGEAGPAAWRGIAVEAGMAEYLQQRNKPDGKPSKDKALSYARMTFAEQVGKAQEAHDSDKVEKEKGDIEKYLPTGIDYMDSVAPKGRFITQGRIVLDVEDSNLPDILGYYDLLFPEENEIIDIKTTASASNSMQMDWARQLGVYWAGTGANPHIWCVQKSSVKAYPLNDPVEAFKDFLRASLTLNRVLATSDDLMEVARFYHPDIDHFMWGDTTKAAAKDIWR